VALGADDVQAAGLEHLLVALFQSARMRSLLGSSSPASPARLEVAAEHDVGTAAGHVGGDGDGAGLDRPGR
jgi:hypothetical protein